MGAIFTLLLLRLPHVPSTFAIAISGENAFQSLAFAAGNAITFETIGPANPLAETQFSLLNAAVNLPIICMGFVDGHAYAWRGVAGGFLADAVISLLCLLLVWGLAALRRAAPASTIVSAG